MDIFDASSHLVDDWKDAGCDCTPDLTDILAVAKISQGVDPLQAALDAQLHAPLIQSFLF